MVHRSRKTFAILIGVLVVISCCCVPLNNITASASSDNSPIIFIPGVMGSELFKNPDGTGMAWPYSKDYGEAMRYGKTLYVFGNERDQASLPLHKREYGSGNLYMGIINSLCFMFPNRQIYFFSYDFRDSNIDSAKRLNDFILNTVKAEKVEVITHSMGGLLLADYAAVYGLEKIEHCVSIGTPFWGAPKLLNSVVNTNLFFNEYDNSVVNRLLDIALKMGGLSKDVKASFPSTAELSPTRDLFDRGNYYRRVNGKNQRLDFEGFEKICVSIFGDNYASSAALFDTLTAVGIEKLLRYDNAYFIVGVKQPTIVGLIFNDGETKQEIECESMIYKLDGDCTVPYVSATMNGALDKLNDERVLKLFATHNGMTSNAKALLWITDILDDAQTSVDDDNEGNTKYALIDSHNIEDVEIMLNNGATIERDIFRRSIGNKLIIPLDGEYLISVSSRPLSVSYCDAFGNITTNK